MKNKEDMSCGRCTGWLIYIDPLESLENVFQRRIIYLFINGGGNVRDVPGDLFKSILFPEECFINKNWNNDL